ncbi:hypothetical protein JCM3774_003406 [Rhodotorula dairenensis]
MSNNAADPSPSARSSSPDAPGSDDGRAATGLPIRAAFLLLPFEVCEKIAWALHDLYDREGAKHRSQLLAAVNRFWSNVCHPMIWETLEVWCAPNAPDLPLDVLRPNAHLVHTVRIRIDTLDVTPEKIRACSRPLYLCKEVDRVDLILLYPDIAGADEQAADLARILNPLRFRGPLIKRLGGVQTKRAPEAVDGPKPTTPSPVSGHNHPGTPVENRRSSTSRQLPTCSHASQRSAPSLPASESPSRSRFPSLTTLRLVVVPPDPTKDLISIFDVIGAAPMLEQIRISGHVSDRILRAVARFIKDKTLPRLKTVSHRLLHANAPTRKVVDDLEGVCGARKITLFDCSDLPPWREEIDLDWSEYDRVGASSFIVTDPRRAA